MLSQLTKTLIQINDPTFKRVIIKGLAWSVFFYVLLITIIGYFLFSTNLFEIGWLDTIFDTLGWFAVLAIASLLLPSIALTAITFLLEEIAISVENKHYPNLPAPRHQSLTELMTTSLWLTLTALLLNLMALPLYLVLLFFPPFNILVFIILNGYLMGREYFELVALRRLPPKKTRMLWRKNRGKLFLTGSIIAGLLSIPLVNWCMPVIAAAYMLHIFEKIRGTGRL